MLVCSLSKLSAYIRRQGGALAVHMLVSSSVLVLIAGAGVDYANIEHLRRRAQHAVDAATLAAANAQVLNQGDGAKVYKTFITEHLKTLPDLTVDTINYKSTSFGYAEITLNASYKPDFMSMIGVSKVPITVHAIAEYDTEADLDITMLLDISPSMLIAATPADLQVMLDNFNCEFACHIMHKGKITYQEALNLGVETRLEAVKAAAQLTFEVARDSDYAKDAAIYFEIYAYAKEFKHIATGEASTMAGDGGAAVRTLQPEPMVDGWPYTDNHSALNALNSVIAKKAAVHKDRLHTIIIMTDGVTDNFTGGRWGKGKREIDPIKSEWCKSLKAHKNVRVGVIYATYHDLPTNNFWRKNVEPFKTEIAPALQECASAGDLFYEATDKDEIIAAFKKLMERSIPRPRLTK